MADASSAPKQNLWLIRHGETEWSLSGKHTGSTDLPLTPRGEQAAISLKPRLAGHDFALVLASPLSRAKETCRLAGFGDRCQTDENLKEWSYGDMEGLSTPEIQATRPGWNLWRDGVTGGETVDAVGARAQLVMARAAQVEGDVLLFAHGHILRILTACWLGLPPVDGRLFALGTATVSVLGWERDTRVITGWNRS